ncbi:hypothetical protein WJX84_005838 [Apatococcus fuscideae]|uniref:Uncharacterized protein n=1 Tax=Apatococcus fuscideae TaxID=2026836 RepID=A0AAW1TDH6_9CHLO
MSRFWVLVASQAEPIESLLEAPARSAWRKYARRHMPVSSAAAPRDLHAALHQSAACQPRLVVTAHLLSCPALGS